MPRAMWSGTISFGLVSIPVKLYPAVRRKGVSFNQLDRRTGSRIKQKRVSAIDGAEVPYDEIVKGYEISPDRYVVITPDELEALDPKKTRSIDIEDFVELDEIDPIFFDHPYYLAPDKGAAKPYKLLLEAMKASGKVAIARVVIRQKESLVAIRPAGDVLTMETMLFADEVVPHERLDDLPGEEVEASDRELKMARQLIDSLSGEFEPEKYHDTYRERVLDLIERKAEGEEVAVQPDAEAPSQVPDLMAALEASLAAVKDSGGDDGGGGSGRKDGSGNGSGKSSSRKSSSGKGAKAKGGGGRSKAKS
jgi:DNA end-binding protein Ku